MTTNKYDGYTTSYSGVDMVVMLLFPGETPITMGTATTLTYSIYRQIAQVRTLGRITSRGYARGGRTYAGTMIFTVIKEAFVEEVRKRVPNLSKHKKLTPDELPPVDVIITFANELGQSSILQMHGLRFVDESQTLSIEDIFTENVLTFVCEEVYHMSEFTGEMVVNGQTRRDKDEKLGKFKVAELMANIEDAERKARLQELAAMEDARFKEPVMSDPGTLPNFDPAPDSYSTTPDTTPGDTPGEGTDSGAQPDGSVSYAITIKVFDALNTKKVLSNASVKTTIDGVGIVKVTDKDGLATFGSIPSKLKGKNLEFIIKKKDYYDLPKNKKVGATGTTETVPVYLQPVNKAPDGMGPVSGDVRTAKKYGKYSNGDTWGKMYLGDSIIPGLKDMKWRFVDSDGDDRLKVILTDVDGKPVENVNVEWHYQIDNYKDMGFWDSLKTYHLETGLINTSKSNKNGVAEMPIVSFKSWPKEARVTIIAKPKLNKQNRSYADAKQFQKWTFYNNDKD